MPVDSITGVTSMQSTEQEQVAKPEAQEQEISLSRVVSMLEQNSGRSSNEVTTGRYNHVTFVPLMLYKLLNPRTNFCNFFFLCIGFLPMVPAITHSCHRRGIRPTTTTPADPWQTLLQTKSLSSRSGPLSASAYCLGSAERCRS